jgi:hypothetical protein
MEVFGIPWVVLGCSFSPFFVRLAQPGGTRVLRERLDLVKLVLYPLLEGAGLSPHLVQTLLHGDEIRDKVSSSSTIHSTSFRKGAANSTKHENKGPVTCLVLLPQCGVWY